jgi:predicted lactoylglutathione lyase
MTIPGRLSLVTLGVTDIARSTAFYESLGWRLSTSSQPGIVSFFATDGSRLGLYGHDALAHDATIETNPPPRYRGVTISINLESERAVDAAIASAVGAGGTLVKPGAKADWGGYSGYFADPDGHLWEVAFNPYWPLGDDGLPVLR